jgi:hypothetical protein
MADVTFCTEVTKLLYCSNVSKVSSQRAAKLRAHLNGILRDELLDGQLADVSVSVRLSK